MGSKSPKYETVQAQFDYGDAMSQASVSRPWLKGLQDGNKGIEAVDAYGNTVNQAMIGTDAAGFSKTLRTLDDVYSASATKKATEEKTAIENTKRAEAAALQAKYDKEAADFASADTLRQEEKRRVEAANAEAKVKADRLKTIEINRLNAQGAGGVRPAGGYEKPRQPRAHSAGTTARARFLGIGGVETDSTNTLG
jgi:hypothetical protein